VLGVTGFNGAEGPAAPAVDTFDDRLFAYGLGRTVTETDKPMLARPLLHPAACRFALPTSSHRAALISVRVMGRAGPRRSDVAWRSWSRTGGEVARRRPTARAVQGRQSTPGAACQRGEPYARATKSALDSKPAN
jgi:hypothetical protein